MKAFRNFLIFSLLGIILIIPLILGSQNFHWAFLFCQIIEMSIMGVGILNFFFISNEILYKKVKSFVIVAVYELLLIAIGYYLSSLYFLEWPEMLYMLNICMVIYSILKIFLVLVFFLNIKNKK